MSEEFRKRVESLAQVIEYKKNFKLIVARDATDPEGRLYLQVESYRLDVIDKSPGIGKGGKNYLSEFMTDSEIVRLAFKAFMSFEEHECREWFRFRGRAVFGPHIDVHALYEAAGFLDVRTPK